MKSCQMGLTKTNGSLSDAIDYLNYFANVPVVSLGTAGGTDCEIRAIFGGAHMDGSFKNLLGLGMLVLAREYGILQPHQPVIESSSGSMGEGLAVAGKILGHPVTIITDPNLPAVTCKKIQMVGAETVMVEQPHPTLGWQQARENKVRELCQQNPSLYWTDQNNSPLNPQTYQRWLVPALSKWLDPRQITAAVFSIGSGGHFSALSSWLKQENPQVKTYAADRPGSITFGGSGVPARIRGVGNQNIVPGVIANHMHLVDGLEYIEEGSAFRACWELAQQFCYFVGGSSGLVYVAATQVAQRFGQGMVLTLFPDRGDIYSETIWNEMWMKSNGYF